MLADARLSALVLAAAIFLTGTIAALASEAARNNPPLAELRGAFQAEFNHDGSRVIARLRTGAAGLWNVDDGTPVSGDLNSTPSATCFQVSKDGKVAVVGFADGAQVFDATTGAAISPRLASALRAEFTNPAVFSPDNRTLIIFTRDQATIWNVQNGEKIAAVPLPAGPHEEAPPSAIFTADGAHCFIMDPNGTVTRYETQRWKPVGKPMTHPRLDAAYEFAFAARADGKWLATFDGAGENGPKGQLQIWDGVTGRALGAPLVRVNGFDAQFFEKSNRVLVKPARGEASVRELPSMKVAFTIPPRDDVEGPSLRLSPDEAWIFSWGADRTIALLDAVTGKLREHYPVKATIMTAIPSPDSYACFVVYDNSTFSTEGHHDNYIMRLRLPDMDVKASFRSSDYLRGTRVSPDGRRLLVLEGGDNDERLLIFNAGDLTEVKAAQQ